MSKKTPNKRVAKKKATKKTTNAKKKPAVKKGFRAKVSRFRASALWRCCKYIGLRVFMLCFVLLFGFTAYLDIAIRKQFEKTQPLARLLNERLSADA